MQGCNWCTWRTDGIFLLDQLPPTRIQQRRRPRHTLDDLRIISPSENSPRIYYLSSSPDRRIPWIRVGNCIGLKGHSPHLNPPFPLGRAIMSSSSATACSRSPSPVTPDTSEIPDTKLSLKSWRSTVPSNVVGPSDLNLHCVLIVLNSLQNDGEEGINFIDFVRETVFDRCLTPIVNCAPGY